MIDQIRPARLSAWLQTLPESAQPVLLDVREPFELQVASVAPAGFTVVAIPMGAIPERLNELDPEQPIACFCHHGSRSMQVASYLERQGFSTVVNVSGGIHAWSGEVDSTVPTY